MALLQCKDCSGPLSSDAKSCPKCGAKPPRQTSLFTKIVGGFFVLVVVSMVLSSVRENRDSALAPAAVAQVAPQPDTDAIATARCRDERAAVLDEVKRHIDAWQPWKAHVVVRPCANRLPADEQYATLATQTEVADYLLTIGNKSAKADERLRAYRALLKADPKTAGPFSAEFKKLENQEAIAALSRWRTDDSVDALTGKKTKTYSVESDNQVNLDFPYKGPQHGRLTVRRHPKYGLNIIFSIEKGQLLCHDSSLDYGRCMVDVRFDDKPPRRVQMGKSSDGDPTYLFVSNEATFLKELVGSKVLIVQPTIFHNGNVPFQFQTIGFPAQ